MYIYIYTYIYIYINFGMIISAVSRAWGLEVQRVLASLASSQKK